ncbi:hypothetical protein Tco_0142621, partial [Tanacetum coccineum]
MLSLPHLFWRAPTAVGHHSATAAGHLRPHENFSGEFSGQVQNCFSPTDLADPLTHAPPLPPPTRCHPTDTTIIVIIAPSSSSSSPPHHTMAATAATTTKKGAFGSIETNPG